MVAASPGDQMAEQSEEKERTTGARGGEVNVRHVCPPAGPHRGGRGRPTAASVHNAEWAMGAGGKKKR